MAPLEMVNPCLIDPGSLESANGLNLVSESQSYLLNNLALG